MWVYTWIFRWFRRLFIKGLNWVLVKGFSSSDHHGDL